MRYCKDCKHYRPGDRFHGMQCSAPARRVESPVHGVYVRWEQCGLARANIADCGPGAAWFEQKTGLLQRLFNN